MVENGPTVDGMKPMCFQHLQSRQRDQPGYIHGMRIAQGWVVGILEMDVSSPFFILSVLLVLAGGVIAYAASEENSGNGKALDGYYDLQNGKRLYEQFCRFCHGEQGKAYDVTPLNPI